MQCKTLMAILTNKQQNDLSLPSRPSTASGLAVPSLSSFCTAHQKAKNMKHLFVQAQQLKWTLKTHFACIVCPKWYIIMWRGQRRNDGRFDSTKSACSTAASPATTLPPHPVHNVTQLRQNSHSSRVRRVENGASGYKLVYTILKHRLLIRFVCCGSNRYIESEHVRASKCLAPCLPNMYGARIVVSRAHLTAPIRLDHHLFVWTKFAMQCVSEGLRSCEWREGKTGVTQRHERFTRTMTNIIFLFSNRYINACSELSINSFVIGRNLGGAQICWLHQVA